MRKAVLWLTVAMTVIPAWALAETAVNPRDFTFKRLSTKDITPGKRITVQIDPEEQARSAGGLAEGRCRTPTHAEQPRCADAPLEPVKPAAASYDWFWDTVPGPRSRLRTGGSSWRWQTLDNGPDGTAVAAPRLQHMQDVAETYGTDILRATIGTNVSPALVLAVIGIESAGKSDAVSSAGAVGLMQLIPATAERFGVTDSTDPVQNIKGGVAYLDWLMKEFDNDPVMVLAAYNAGEGAVRANAACRPMPRRGTMCPRCWRPGRWRRACASVAAGAGDRSLRASASNLSAG